MGERGALQHHHQQQPQQPSPSHLPCERLRRLNLLTSTAAANNNSISNNDSTDHSSAQRRARRGMVRGGVGGEGGGGTGPPCRVARTLVVGLALMMMLMPSGAQALCEDRCERVVPMVTTLRQLWSRSFKRVGERRVSFEEFIASLVRASSNNGHSRAQRLGTALLTLIRQYQDCVMACEHPFSKRGASGGPPFRLSYSSSRFKSPCSKQKLDADASPLLIRLCMTYGP